MRGARGAWGGSLLTAPGCLPGREPWGRAAGRVSREFGDVPRRRDQRRRFWVDDAGRPDRDGAMAQPPTRAKATALVGGGGRRARLLLRDSRHAPVLC
jgi:hypothetical protein